MPTITPDMLVMLVKAAAGNGEVSITRPRQASWTDELHLIRMLEKGEYLSRVGLIDRPAEDTVTAVYLLTSRGRRTADAVDIAPPAPSAQRVRSKAARKG